MAEMKRILALAVGDPKFSQILDHPSKRYGVRPYISGLVEALTKHDHQLGTNYVIDYRQNWYEDIDKGHAFTEMQDPALIYVMSTSVLRAAGKHTSKIPIVFPNCSFHQAEQLVKDHLATGFSAQRTQTAGHCFDRFFKTVPSLKEVFILHRDDYDVSDHAVKLVTEAAKKSGVKSTAINVKSHSDLLAKLSELPERVLATEANIGVHITPTDLLFAETPAIIKWVQETKNLPAFYPVGDWVPNGLGAYGVPQYRCGERTAELVHQILWVNKPNSALPPVLEAVEKDFEWVVSRAAFAALQMPKIPMPMAKDGMRIV
jgi:ABC-type uncharacterized transport system substrate-binding protein